MEEQSSEVQVSSPEVSEEDGTPEELESSPKRGRSDRRKSKLVEAELAKLRSKRSPYADWRDYSLLDCNKFMLKFQVNCDTLVSVGADHGEETEFACHSYMLCSRSVVFERLLLPDVTSRVIGPLTQTEAHNRKNVISVPDVDPDAFWELLKYLYYEGAELRRENVFQIYYASNKFRLHLLSALCRQWIRDNVELNEETVCELMDESVANKAYFLTADCVQYFDLHPEVWETQQFRGMSAEALERVYVYYYLQPQQSAGKSGHRPVPEALK